MKKVSVFRKRNKVMSKPVAIASVSVLIILLLAAALVFFFKDSLFYSRRALDMRDFTLDEQMQVAINSEGFSADKMLDRTIDLLVKDTETEPLIMSRQLLPGQLQSMPAVYSDQLNAMDQISLARIYIARGDKRSSQQLLEEIYASYSDDNGRLVGYILAVSEGDDSDNMDVWTMRDESKLLGPSLEATVAYLRAMLEYYDRWGTPSDWARVEMLASAVFDGEEFYNDIAFSPSKMSELIVGLDDYDGYLSDRGDESVYTAYRLSSLDLYAFQILAKYDSDKYQPMYDKAVEIVRGGMLTDDLPLFARAYSDSSGGYVYFMGEEAHVEIVSSLRVMLHLAEIGALPASSLAWLRQQIYNNGFLYSHYDILWGSAVTTDEAIEAYGLTLRIAVVVEDPVLFSHTLKALSRSRATLETSPAREMVFRRFTSQRNMVVAEDNLQVLLALCLG